MERSRITKRNTYDNELMAYEREGKGKSTMQTEVQV